MVGMRLRTNIGKARVAMEVRTLVTAEEAMSMARTYFTVHESTKVVAFKAGVGEGLPFQVACGEPHCRL